MKPIIALTVLALSPLCFTSALAEKRGKGEFKKHLIEKFDANGDGQLDEDERATAKEARAEKRAEIDALRETYDVDGNGELDEAERSAFREAMQARLVERFDADGDGELNDEEQAQADSAKRGLKGCKGKGGCNKERDQKDPDSI